MRRLSKREQHELHPASPLYLEQRIVELENQIAKAQCPTLKYIVCELEKWAKHRQSKHGADYWTMAVLDVLPDLKAAAEDPMFEE